MSKSILSDMDGVSSRETVEEFPYRPDYNYIFDNVGAIDLQKL